MQSPSQEVVIARQEVEIVSDSEQVSLPDGVDLSSVDGTEAQRQKVHAMFSKYSTIFAVDDDSLGCTHAVKHSINTVDDIPIRFPYRHIPPPQMEEVKQHLQLMLKKGIIRYSTSPYASPVVLVRKKSGALRICNDFRILNSKSVKDAHPLPRIEETIHALAGAKMFSVMDLQSAYHQVEMEEKDKAKTAFITPFSKTTTIVSGVLKLLQTIRERICTDCFAPPSTCRTVSTASSR